MSVASCRYRFHHPDRPADTCPYEPLDHDGFCVFHSYDKPEDFAALLKHAIESGAWLEGAIVDRLDRGATLAHAQMPSANFEVVTFSNVVISDAILEGASFISASFECTIMARTNLRRAKFDGAAFRCSEPGDYSIDFSQANLELASFSGCELFCQKLSGARTAGLSPISVLIAEPCYEMQKGFWDDAASIYSSIGKGAADSGDYYSSDRCAYLSASCRHRAAMEAGPIYRGRIWGNWIKPTLRKGPVGIVWMLHRSLWGYGLFPFRILWAIVFLIVFFGVCIFPFVAVGPLEKPVILDSIVFSIDNFSGMTYPGPAPKTLYGRLAGGLETLFGSILLTMFLGALIGKYLRRH